MTRDEVLEVIHRYAQWSHWTASDGGPAMGPSSYKTYLAKFAEGLRDLMRDDTLISAEDVSADVFFRHYHQRLWDPQELLKSHDLRIVRHVEMDLAKTREAREAWHEKWGDVDLPGDLEIR